MSIVLPRSQQRPQPSPYEVLGLRDLPFPTEPVVNPYSADPRRNGTIFAADSVRKEIDRFERLLIRPNDFRNRVRLAYLWSKGDQQSGRGMGKTALLRYFRQRINQDWGYTEFDGQFSAAVVYVSFPSQVDRRYMEQLALAGLVDVCRSGVLDASRAKLRLEAVPAEKREGLLESGGPAVLLDNARLSAEGIEPADLDANVCSRLVDEGITDAVASDLATGDFEDYLKSMRRDRALQPLYVPRDTRILDFSRDLLFNDVVRYLKAAGFAGGYLFIDDIENLVDQMSRRHRIEFAKEFALCTVRPGYANTDSSFFSCVLTTHQQASVGLSQAWGDAGLAAIARLDPTAPNSVELPLPSKDAARQIVLSHLDHYRIDRAAQGSPRPFTEDGMDELLRDRLHPRILLARAAAVMQQAVQVGITSVDAAFVREAAADPAQPMGTPDITEGLEGAL